jgi:hypothetical protein
MLRCCGWPQSWQRRTQQRIPTLHYLSPDPVPAFRNLHTWLLLQSGGGGDTSLLWMAAELAAPLTAL